MSQNILVTGTSSGFGRLTVLSLARKGHQLFAAMRDIGGRNRKSAEELRNLAESEKIQIHVVEMDVNDDASVAAAVKGVLDKAGHLDVVVNNAGLSAVGLVETHTTDQVRQLFEVNVLGPHRVARAVLPAMRARGKGLLIGVSSTLGRVVLPLMSPYCATKFAVEALFEGYRMELKPTGVESTLVQPGAFPTNLVANSLLGAEQDRAAGYGPLANGLQQMGATFEQMFSGPNVPNPQTVADAIVGLVEAPAGSRPARVAVDWMLGPVLEGLNKNHTDAQQGVLTGMGMGMLAG